MSQSDLPLDRSVPTRFRRPKRLGRWLKRLSYCLVGGTLFLTTLDWVLERQAVFQFLMTHVNRLVVEETGLPLKIARLDLNLWTGSASLHQIALGEDLLTISKLSIQADPRSLLSSTPRIWGLRIEYPRILLSEDRLARIRVKPRPPSQDPLKLFLDFLNIQGGVVESRSPCWGLPPFKAHFEVNGVGLGPNHQAITLLVPYLDVQGPQGMQLGRMDIVGQLSASKIEIQEGYARLGSSQVRWTGQIQPENQEFQAQSKVMISLKELRSWSPGVLGDLSGDLDLRLQGSGMLSSPKWSLEASSEILNPGRWALEPGSLFLSAQGTLDQLKLRKLRWMSPEGLLELNGEWRRRVSTWVQLDRASIDLRRLLVGARLTDLNQAQLEAKARVELRGQEPWAPKLLEGLVGEFQGRIQGREKTLGEFGGKLQKGQLQLDRFLFAHLDTTLEASGSFQMGAQPRFEGKGQVLTEASKVAQVLKAWDIVPLDMDGKIHAEAQVFWDPVGAFRLKGLCEVQNPRYVQARADWLRADVQIEKDELRIQDIYLEKGHGAAWGELWLQWHGRDSGQPQMDMCFRSSRLPISEGLGAADLQELAMDGQASGWTRIHGAFQNPVLEGSAQVEEATVYGVHLPAIEGDFHLDLRNSKLSVKELRLAASMAELAEEESSGPLALNGSAELDLDAQTWNARLKGRVDTQVLQLPGPRFQAQVKLQSQGSLLVSAGPLSLPSLDLDVQHGRLFLGAQTLEGLSAKFSIQDKDISAQAGFSSASKPAWVFQGHTQDSRLSFNTRFSLDSESCETEQLSQRMSSDVLQNLHVGLQLSGIGDAQGFQWKGQLEHFMLRFPVFSLRLPEPSSIHGDAHLAHLNLGLLGEENDAGRPSSARLDLKGPLPLSMEKPMGLEVSANMELRGLKSILDEWLDLDPSSFFSELTLQGKLGADLSIQGAYTRPQLNGQIQLQHVQANARSLPQSLEDLNATLVLQGNKLLIPEDRPLKGFLAQGLLSVSGDLDWRPDASLERYRFKLRLDEAQLRDVPTGLDLQGSLDLRLVGTQDSGVLSGRVLAHRLVYRAEIQLADLLMRNNLSGLSSASLSLDNPLDRIALNVEVHLDQPWRLESNLAKLQGLPESHFKLSQTLAHPGIRGKMQLLPGGRLTNLLPAGDVIVESGSIYFPDPRSLDPVFQLNGSVNVPPYLVSLGLNGTLSQLQFNLSSTPTLRSEEIVNLLINPASAQEVGSSAFSTQGNLSMGLASAGSGLLTNLTLARLQEQLRRTFRLDRVSVAIRTGTGGNTESELTVGKTLAGIPLVGTVRKSGELTTSSGQVEWRKGNLILQLGLSKTASEKPSPTGEIRFTWSPE